MAEEILQRAITAFKAGRKEEARTLFMDVVEQDQHNEQAWLYLSALVDTLEEQQICLENVLTVNPNHEKAKQGLETVLKKIAAQGGTPTPPEPPPAPAPAEPSTFGGSSSAPIGAEFADASGDSLFGDAPTSDSSAFGSSFDGGIGSDFDFGAQSDSPDAGSSDAFGSFADDTGGSDDPFSWMADASTPAAPPSPPADVDTPSTSVDWGSDDQPAVYGSGQHIEEPDYDQWMDDLPLGNSTPEQTVSVDPPDSLFAAASSPSPFDDSAPFNDTSYMVDEEMAADPTFGNFGTENASMWDTAAAEQPGSAAFGSDPFADLDDEDDAFGMEPDAFGSDAVFADAGDAPVEASPFGTFDFGDDADSSAGDSGFNFSFDDNDASPATSSAASQPGAEYYRQIPSEIEAFSGGMTRRTVMLMGGILILLALNAASFLMLMG